MKKSSSLLKQICLVVGATAFLLFSSVIPAQNYDSNGACSDVKKLVAPDCKPKPKPKPKPPRKPKKATAN